MDSVIDNLGLQKYSQESSALRAEFVACNFHLQTLKKREACELLIWATPLQETLEEVRLFENLKQEKFGKFHKDQRIEPPTLGVMNPNPSNFLT